MFPLLPTYYRPADLGQIPTSDEKHLTVDGRVRPLVPFQFIPGNQSLPGISPYGDEKTGVFSDGYGRLGVSVFGQRRFVLCDNGIEIWDTNGSLVGVMGPQDVLARAGTDILAGMVVTYPSGTLTEPTVVPANTTSGNPAAGMAAWTVAAGGIVLVRNGVVSLPDWTAITGARTLASPQYYLAPGGLLTATPGGQLVCNRVGPNTVQVHCRSLPLTSKFATLTGTLDGVNTTFSLPEAGSVVCVYLNGLAGEAFTTISSTSVQLTDPPLSADLVQAVYLA